MHVSEHFCTLEEHFPLVYLDSILIIIIIIIIIIINNNNNNNYYLMMIIIIMPVRERWK